MLRVFSRRVDSLCFSARLGRGLSCGWGLANPVVVVVLLNYFIMRLFLLPTDTVVPPRVRSQTERFG